MKKKKSQRLKLMKKRPMMLEMMMTRRTQNLRVVIARSLVLEIAHANDLAIALVTGRDTDPVNVPGDVVVIVHAKGPEIGPETRNEEIGVEAVEGKRG
jgi:hypothetical protein